MKFLILFLSIFVACVTSTRRNDVAEGLREFRGVHMVTRFNEELNVTEEVNREEDNSVDALDHVNTKSRETRTKRRRNRGRKRGHRLKLDLEEDAERRVRDSSWFYCDNNEIPREVLVVMMDISRRGLMCSGEYPTHTCCAENDLTVELIGAKIVEQIPDIQCSRMMMKLRCAHCSPRSWWLFHAPDKRRSAHPRSMPILCPKFCRKFHKACRNHVAGLNEENYCDFHTTNADGPCFPDYEIRRGTID